MPKVMIVDDDRTTTGLLSTLLELDGFEVVLAADGTKAMSMAHETSPDIFIVDYHLADYEGTDFIKDLRNDAQFSKTPVLMSSGLNREKEALSVGANRFLLKPFDPGELVNILNELLS